MSEKRKTIAVDSREAQISSFSKRLKACTAGKMPAAQTAAELEKLIVEIGEAKTW